MQQFERKTAIVTGGAQGMGRQYVRLLAEAGANVVLADINAEVAERAARKEKPKRGGERRRLSYNQQRALERLPGEIETLDGQISALEAKLADPALYARDPAAFDETAVALTQARKDKAAKSSIR